jgi:hypothetical protein
MKRPERRRVRRGIAKVAMSSCSPAMRPTLMPLPGC